MKFKLLYFFIKTPVGMAFTFTVLYGAMFFVMPVLNKIPGFNIINLILEIPVFILWGLLGCGFLFGSGCVHHMSDGLFLTILFIVIFLFFWIVIKIIFLAVVTSQTEISNHEN